jgi:hypothetical protein
MNQQATLYRILMNPFWLFVQVAKFPFLLAVFSVGTLVLLVLHDSASRNLLFGAAVAGEALWWTLFVVFVLCTCHRADRLRPLTNGR